MNIKPDANNGNQVENQYPSTKTINISHPPVSKTTLGIEDETPAQEECEKHK